MAELLSAENFGPKNIADTTRLTADAAAGQAVINVANLGDIGPNTFVLIGQEGVESAELKKVQSVAGLAVTLTTNLLIKQIRNTKVSLLRSDKVRFYRAPWIEGVPFNNLEYSLIATVDIKPDSLTTEYTDLLGGRDFVYKYTYYNSDLDRESPLADAIGVRGGGTDTYITVDEVRDEAGITSNRWITPQFVYEKILAAQSEVNAALVKGGYALPLVSVPEVVKQAARLIAAGYVLLKDYGPEYEGLSKDGERKLEQGRKLLENLSASAGGLTDGDGQAIARGRQVRAYPDSSATRFFAKDRVY